MRRIDQMGEASRQIAHHEVHDAVPLSEPDYGEYLPELADYDLSESQKIEYLRTLWQIMCGFVDLGWGVDAVNLALPGLAKISLETRENEVELGNQSIENVFEAAARKPLESEDS